MKKVSNDFILGLSGVALGLRLIFKNSTIRRFAIIPFVIDFFVLLTGLFVGISYLGGWADALMLMFFPDLAGSVFFFAKYLLLFVFWLAFLLALFIGVYLVAMVVASPFNGMLAEETLKVCNARIDKEESLRRWANKTVRLLVISLVKSVVFAVLGLILTLVGLIPGVNLLAGFGLFLILAFDSADYAFEILNFDLRQRLRFFRQNIACFAGVATSIGLTVLIPGLNFFLFPAAIVGSSLMVSQIIQNGK